MTMKRARRIVPASVFKARCLALIDEVAASRETIVVTKRGRPVARLVAMGGGRKTSLRGSVKVHGDLVASLGDPWDAER